MMRRRLKQTASLEGHTITPPNEIRAQVEALPPGSEERRRMERKARVAEVGAHMNEWLSSPGLQPPK
jgi:hypothetical protein